MLIFIHLDKSILLPLLKIFKIKDGKNKQSDQNKKDIDCQSG